MADEEDEQLADVVRLLPEGYVVIEHSAEPDESLARLTIYSETSSAHQLADALGVAPDESRDKGERTKRGLVRQFSSISFRSGVPGDASPDEHLSDLLKRIEPWQAPVMRQVEAGNDARLKLAFFGEAPNPAFTLSTDVLRRISDFGLELELDIYAF